MATRTQTYVVRPFLGLDPVDEILERVRVKVDDREYEPGSIALTEEQLEHKKVSLVIGISGDELRAALEPTDIPDVDCALIVMARSNTFRSHHIIFSKAAHSDDFPSEIDIDTSVAPLILQDKNGFNLTIAVVLLHNLQPQALRPRTAGTWLARRDFVLKPQRDEAVFTPIALDDTTRQRLGLQSGTFSFVDVGELLIADSLSDEVTVYLDEDALNTILRNPSEPLSKQIQAELASVTLNVVLQSALSAIKSAKQTSEVTVEDLIEYPAVLRLFQTMSTRMGRELTAVLGMSDSPDRLRAEIQSLFSLRSITELALREG